MMKFLLKRRTQKEEKQTAAVPSSKSSLSLSTENAQSQKEKIATCSSLPLSIGRSFDSQSSSSFTAETPAKRKTSNSSETVELKLESAVNPKVVFRSAVEPSSSSGSTALLTNKFTSVAPYCSTTTLFSKKRSDSSVSKSEAAVVVSARNLSPSRRAYTIPSPLCVSLNRSPAAFSPMDVTVPSSAKTSSATASNPLPQSATAPNCYESSEANPASVQRPASAYRTGGTSTSSPRTSVSRMFPVISDEQPPLRLRATSSLPTLGHDSAALSNLHKRRVFSFSSESAEDFVCKSNSSDDQNPFASLPFLHDVSEAESFSLFLQKIQLCRHVYDFDNPDSCVAAKEGKRIALQEIVEYINSTRNCFTETSMKAIMEMISANIFKPLPVRTAASAYITSFMDSEDEEPKWESGWPHLHLVYEIFLRFVVSNEVDPKAAKRYIDQRFILKLLNLFSSEDSRERDYLKTILHRIYGKMMALRAFIRKSIQHLFAFFVSDPEATHRGVAELLEILGSIINGFARPLKEEHKFFLEKSLIPLHKARSLSTFSQQLTYCVAQYLEKDETLTECVVMGLLKLWPVTNTAKEVLFLTELEELLDFIHQDQFKKIMYPLFRQLAICIQSPHFQVAERVLFYWNSETFINLLNSHRQQLFPIVISALYKNSKDHWNSTVHGLTYNVSKLLAETDPKLFDECSIRNLTLEEQMVKEDTERQRIWESLETDFLQTHQCSSVSF